MANPDDEFFLDTAFGLNGVADPLSPYAHLPYEKRLAMRKYAVLDREHDGIYVAGDDKQFSALTSQFAREAPIVAAGAIGAAAGTAALNASPGAKTLAAIPYVGAGAQVVAPLIGGVVGTLGATKLRDAVEDPITTAKADADARFNQDNHPTQSYLAHLAALGANFQMNPLNAFRTAAGFVKHALPGMAVGTSIEAGKQIAAGEFDPVAVAKAAVEGAALGKPRAVNYGLGTTAGRGAANVVRGLAGEAPVPIREASTTNPAFIPGSGVGKLAENDPVTAEAILKMFALKRNYTGQRDVALKDLRNATSFKQQFPEDVANYTEIANSGWRKRNEAYHKGFTQEYRDLLKTRNTLENDLAEANDMIAKNSAQIPAHQAAVAAKDQLATQLADAEKAITDYEIRLASHNKNFTANAPTATPLVVPAHRYEFQGKTTDVSEDIPYHSSAKNASDSAYGLPGSVVSEDLVLHNPLTALSIDGLKAALKLPQSANYQQVAQAAHAAGHDGISFMENNEPVYVKFGDKALHYDAGLTPQERAALAPFSNYAKETANAVRANNPEAKTTAGDNPNWMAQQINLDEVTAIKAIRDPRVQEAAFEAYVKKLALDPRQQAFVEAHGGIWNDKTKLEAINHFQGLINDAAGSGITQNSRSYEQDENPYGALVRNARRFSLLDLAHKDIDTTLEKSGAKYADSQAKAEAFNTPYLRRRLSYENQGDDAVKAQTSTDIGQEMKDYITQSSKRSTVNEAVTGFQRLANSSVMSLGTGVKNIISGTMKSVGDVVGPDTALAIAKGNIDTFNNYAALRDAALRQGSIKAGSNDDFAFTEDQALADSVANSFRKMGQALTKVANTAQKWTGSNFLEEVSRVRDFAVGRRMAALALRSPTDPVSSDWLKRHAAGTERGYTADENIDRMAANYVESQQSAYNASSLPLSMVQNPKHFGQEAAQLYTRIQRYGVDTTLRNYRNLIGAADRGDARPLVAATLAAIAGRKVLQGFDNAIAVNPQPSDEEEELKNLMGAPEGIQGLNRTVNWMAAMDGYGILGSLGGALTTAANRIKGAPFDYTGSPALSSAKAVGESVVALVKAQANGADMAQAAVDELIGSGRKMSQLFRVVDNKLLMSDEEKARREDTSMLKQYQDWNAQGVSPADRLMRAVPFMEVDRQRHDELHQLTDNLQGRNRFVNFTNVWNRTAPQLRDRQIKDAFDYSGEPADGRKDAEYMAYIERTFGREAADAIRRRAGASQKRASDRLLSLPPLQYLPADELDPAR